MRFGMSHGGSPPAVGAEVTGSLEWERRYLSCVRIRRLHMLAGVIWRTYGAQVTGGNMEPLRARMDFEFESMRRELVEEIEQKVNQEITGGATDSDKESCRVRSLCHSRSDSHKINLLPEGIAQIRVVDIVGLDLQADGGYPCGQYA